MGLRLKTYPSVAACVSFIEMSLICHLSQPITFAQAPASLPGTPSPHSHPCVPTFPAAAEAAFVCEAVVVTGVSLDL